MTLDLTKPVRLADGTPARVLCTDFKGYLPVVIAIPSHYHADKEDAVYRGIDGQAAHVSPSRFLVNAPEVRHEYQNVYADGSKSTVRYSERLSPPTSIGPCLGYLKFTFEDGRFVGVEFIGEVK